LEGVIQLNISLEEVCSGGLLRKLQLWGLHGPSCLLTYCSCFSTKLQRMHGIPASMQVRM
jgi:hypothetical protein